MRVFRHTIGLLGAALTVLCVPVSPAIARDKTPKVDNTDLDRQLAALPRLPANQRKIVTIYQFRSGVAGISNQAMTDMFMTALVKSGAFLVAERQNLVPDIQVEKQLNSVGAATGTAASTQLAGAQFIFEGVVSESNPDASAGEAGVTISGMSIGGNRQKMAIAIDVRILDSGTGLVMDTVSISQDVRSGGSKMSGFGSLANGISALSGGPSIPLSPDASFASSGSDGVDRALRQCIYMAVLELAKRYGAQVKAAG
jgi:curli biogenesis system outer membrane secretion channel CsgG